MIQLQACFHFFLAETSGKIVGEFEIVEIVEIENFEIVGDLNMNDKREFQVKSNREFTSNKLPYRNLKSNELEPIINLFHQASSVT